MKTGKLLFAIVVFIGLFFISDNVFAATYSYTITNESNFSSDSIVQVLSNNIPTWYTKKYDHKKYGIHITIDTVYQEKSHILLYYIEVGLHRSINTKYDRIGIEDYLFSDSLGYIENGNTSFSNHYLSIELKKTIHDLMNLLIKKRYPLYSINSKKHMVLRNK